MKIFKKVLSLFLAGMTFATCLAGTAFPVTAARTDYKANTAPNYNHAMDISGKTYAYHITINQEFSWIDVYMPTWNVINGTYCTLAR